MRLCRPTSPALVIGSTQPDSDVDASAARAAGLDVVRRRSGGGAVLVEAAGLAWVDVEVPAADPLWEADVGRAFWWLGQAWVEALGAVGVGPAVVHRGAIVASPWSRLVCFAGLGPGEVTLGGRKVVGMAQRRARPGALFQCAVPLRWEPADLLGVLALDSSERARAGAALGDAVHAVVGVSPDELFTALVDHLP